MDPSVRIGLELPTLPAGAGIDQVTTWRSMAVTAERAGFGALWIADGDCEPCTLAGGLVPVTSSITLGVVCDLGGGRHPGVLARDLTTLDVLSDGRAALLLSAPPDEAERLAEAVPICQALFAGDAPHVIGRHYLVAGAVNRPGPVRPGGPPLLVQGPTEVPGAGWVVAGSPSEVAAVRRVAEGPLLWRGAVSDVAHATALYEAGADGVIARVYAAEEVAPLAATLVGLWGA